MQFLRVINYAAIVISLLASDLVSAQTTVTIGTGTSSSSTRGPFQRSETSSSTVYSRWVHTYTATELAAAGIPNGAAISQLNWELASSNVIIGSGNANLKVYIKNSTATSATADTWTNLTSGSTLAVDNDYNTSNNFPGSNGWMPFSFIAPFAYTGGAIEIAVDWDCSSVSTPAFSGDGALKWRWQTTAPDTLVVKKTSSSSPSTTISDLKDERANIQFVFTAVVCDIPTSLNAVTTTSTADLSWSISTNAASYDWRVVPVGAGVGATAIDSGTAITTFDMATGLSPLTSYDFFVEADCGTVGTSGFAGPYSFMTLPLVQDSVTIGVGTSSSSTRGPFQRSDTASSTVYSRFVHVYTATELAAAGITSGDSITALNWELASSNVIIGDGDANLKVYVKNSSATSATVDTWANLITGSSLLVNNDYNTANNFLGANGWMPFNFNAPFEYTGGSIEIAVDWDCSQVATPAFSGDGSLKWRWETTAPTNLVVKNTSSSGPSTNISNLSDERANIQLVYAITTCAAPTGLTVDNIGTTTADLNWSGSLGSSSYDWKIVLAGAGSGATAVDFGNTVDTSATSTALAAGISYDLYVASDCGGIGASTFAGPITFTTLCGLVPTTVITTDVTDVLCNGDDDGAIDLTVTAGVAPYVFAWSNAEITEDISGLTAGTYSLTITDGSGCPYFDSVIVAEPTAISLSATTVVNASCNGDADGAIDVTVDGGVAPYAFVWTNAETSEDISGLGAGIYTLTVTDDNGCTFSDDVTVDEPTALTLTTTSTPDTNNAGVGSASVTATGGTMPYTYAWDGTAGSADLTGLTAGTYVAEVTDSNGCSDTMSVVVDNIVGISSIDYVTELSISPNPTNGVAFLNLELSESAEVSVSIYTIRGELVESLMPQRVNQLRQPIDLTSYGDGLYFVRVSINEQTTTHKIIFIQ